MAFWGWAKSLTRGGASDSDTGASTSDKAASTSPGNGGNYKPTKTKIPGAWQQSDDESDEETAVRNDQITEQSEEGIMSPAGDANAKGEQGIEVIFDYDTEVREEEHNRQIQAIQDGDNVHLPEDPATHDSPGTQDTQSEQVGQEQELQNDDNVALVGGDANHDLHRTQDAGSLEVADSGLPLGTNAETPRPGLMNESASLDTQERHDDEIFHDVQTQQDQDLYDGKNEETGINDTDIKELHAEVDSHLDHPGNVLPSVEISAAEPITAAIATSDLSASTVPPEIERQVTPTNAPSEPKFEGDVAKDNHDNTSQDVPAIDSGDQKSPTIAENASNDGLLDEKPDTPEVQAVGEFQAQQVESVHKNEESDTQRAPQESPVPSMDSATSPTIPIVGSEQIQGAAKDPFATPVGGGSPAPDDATEGVDQSIPEKPQVASLGILTTPSESHATQSQQADHLSEPKPAEVVASNTTDQTATAIAKTSSSGDKSLDGLNMRGPSTRLQKQCASPTLAAENEKAVVDTEEMQERNKSQSSPLEKTTAAESLQTKPKTPGAQSTPYAKPSESTLRDDVTPSSSVKQSPQAKPKTPSAQPTPYAKPDEPTRDDATPSRSVKQDSPSDIPIKREGGDEPYSPIPTLNPPPTIADPIRRIHVPAGNKLIENGQAATLPVVDFPLLSPNEIHRKGPTKCVTAGQFLTSRTLGNPDKTAYYDSRGTVEVMKFAHTKADTSMTKSDLSEFENFSAKRDVKGNAPSGKPAWVTVNGQDYFLSYAGQVALWGNKNETHSYKREWVNQNAVRRRGHSRLMLIGNVEVPDKVGKPMNNFPKELFDEFNIQDSKSKGLKLNRNAGRKRKMAAGSTILSQEDEADGQDDGASNRNMDDEVESPSQATSKGKGKAISKKRRHASTSDHDAATEEVATDDGAMDRASRKRQRTEMFNSIFDNSDAEDLGDNETSEVLGGNGDNEDDEDFDASGFSGF
jgi:hypothetical protein